MVALRMHYDACPCGSGRLIRDCCIKSCGNIRPTDGADIEHLNCYAKELGKCSKVISGEHWLSANLLWINEPLGHVVIGGVPWLKQLKSQQLPISAVKSKILCTRHNSALSPLDVLGGRFFGAFPSIKQRPKPN